MFLTALKVAVVESLRAVWFENQNVGQEAQDLNDDLDQNAKLPTPRRVTLEYPEEAEEWPAVLVQVRPNLVEWTGISPDEVIDAAQEDGGLDIDFSKTTDDPPPENPSYRLIRQGRFEATCMLQVLALSTQERDRIWDNLVKLLMMGDKKAATRTFFTTFEEHDLIGVTILRGSIRPVGDSMGPGTPWDEELLTYEAAIEFDMVGTFYADEYTEELVPLRAAQVFEYIAWSGNDQPPPDNNETPPGESDGDGEWRDVWI